MTLGSNYRSLKNQIFPKKSQNREDFTICTLIQYFILVSKMEVGKFYHLYNRGVNKQPIFFYKENYNFFLRRLKFYLSDYIDVYSYTLMPNHFHLFFKVKNTNGIVKGKSKSIQASFKIFLMSYAKAINNLTGRCGPLFQQKFKLKEVNNDAYFSWLIQYIHLNPVKSKLCSSPELWEFSSYNAIVSESPTLVKRDEILEWFGGRERFVRIHLENTFLTKKARSRKSKHKLR